MAASTSSLHGHGPVVVASRPRWLRYSVRAAGVGLALTGLVGLLHLPALAPILRKISPSFACPIRHGTPEQIDRAHALGAAAIRDSATSFAPARPALGFVLDRSRKSDIDAWAAKYRVSCHAIGGNETLQKCVDVPAAAVGEPDALGPLEEVNFELNAHGELVNVQGMRRRLSTADASAAVVQLEKNAASSLGPPTTLGGQPTAAALGKGMLSSYVAEHAFKDYRATVSATNLPPTGVMVREEYLSAR